jgi:hypothetical protein
MTLYLNILDANPTDRFYHRIKSGDIAFFTFSQFFLNNFFLLNFLHLQQNNYYKNLEQQLELYAWIALAAPSIDLNITNAHTTSVFVSLSNEFNSYISFSIFFSS